MIAKNILVSEESRVKHTNRSLLLIIAVNNLRPRIVCQWIVFQTKGHKSVRRIQIRFKYPLKSRSALKSCLRFLKLSSIKRTSHHWLETTVVRGEHFTGQGD